MDSKLAILAPSAQYDLQLLSVDEVQRLLCIGRTKFYELVASGRLKTLKLGRRMLIRLSDLQTFVATLPAAGRAQ